MSKQIKVTIDGIEYISEAGKNLLTLCKEESLNVPYLCHQKYLSPTGACRLCMVKVKDMRGLAASCAVTLSDGMVVTTRDEEIIEARKRTIENLLVEHNKQKDVSARDKLIEYAEEYGVSYDENDNDCVISHTDFSSPVLDYDSSKCIKCFRCIKGCSELQGKGVLSIGGRGYDSYVVAGTGKWSESECDGCGECVQLCPTGALVEKPNRDKIDVTKFDEKVRTTCPYCGVGCQLEYSVRDNKIQRAEGIRYSMPNSGRLCVKGRFGYDFISSENRLKTPLIKRNGKFDEASWDEALDLIASKFSGIKSKYGKESIAGYSSARCTNEDNYIFSKFMRLAVGTNNMDYCTRLCHASTVTAMLKSIGDGAASASIQDFEETECTFVIGNNIIETHPVTATYLKRGKDKGNKIVLVDPKWTPLVKYADVWLQAKLGTDVALLNGIAHILIREDLIDNDFINSRVEGGQKAFEDLKALVQKYTPEYVEEITGVPVEKLEKAAMIYGSAKTALIATGMGTSQQLTGTDNVFALLNMMLITGQVGRELAGIAPPRGQNNVQGATDVGCSPIYYPGYIHCSNDDNRKRIAKLWDVEYESLPSKVGLTTIEIIDKIDEGQIKAMLIMGENPMHTDPNLNHTKHAFKKLDFIVAIDIFPTLTTEFADVILPASALAEKEGTVVSSDRRVLKINKVVESPGQARWDWKIIHEISKRMGVNLGDYNSSSDIFDEIGQATKIMAGISFERLDNNEELQWPCLTKEDKGTGTLYKDGFNTPTGKATLFPVDFKPQNQQPDKEYPLLLNTGRLLYQYHSATMSRECDTLNNFINEPYMLIHPNDAEEYSVKTFDKVKLSSAQGELEVKARVSDHVSIGQVFIPWHFKEALVNNLTRSEKDPMSKIAALKYTPCKLEKI